MITMAKNNSTRTTTLFSEDIDRGLGNAVAKGILGGSLIAVIMLAAFCAVGAAAGQWNQGMAWCISAILAGIAGGLLQQFWLGYSVLVKPSYPVRIAGFGLTYFVALAACAAIGNWLPGGQPQAWMSFAILYVAILAVITAAFTIVFRLRGASYTERLEAYRRKHGN